MPQSKPMMWTNLLILMSILMMMMMMKMIQNKKKYTQTMNPNTPPKTKW